MNSTHRPAGAARTARLASLFHDVEARLAMTALAIAFTLTALQPVFAHDTKSANAGPVHVEQPWARATPPGAKVAGAFAVIENHGSTPDRLVSATAEIAGRVEIHEMAVTDGVMTMRPLPDGLPVPADGSVELKPGSYHLMLMDLSGPLKDGEHVAGTLTFEKAGTVPVEFVVAPIGAKAPAGHTSQ
jgi:copper(I)-binding protein